MHPIPPVFLFFLNFVDENSVAPAHCCRQAGAQYGPGSNSPASGTRRHNEPSPAVYCQFLLPQIHSTGHHQVRMRAAGITITVRSDQWLTVPSRQYISFPSSIDEDDPFHRSNLYAQGRWARYQTHRPARSGSSIFPPASPQLGSTPGHPTNSYRVCIWLRYSTCRACKACAPGLAHLSVYVAKVCGFGRKRRSQFIPPAARLAAHCAPLLVFFLGKKFQHAPLELSFGQSSQLTRCTRPRHSSHEWASQPQLGLGWVKFGQTSQPASLTAQSGPHSTFRSAQFHLYLFHSRTD